MKTSDSALKSDTRRGPLGCFDKCNQSWSYQSHSLGYGQESGSGCTKTVQVNIGRFWTRIYLKPKSVAFGSTRKVQKVL